LHRRKTVRKQSAILDKTTLSRFCLYPEPCLWYARHLSVAATLGIADSKINAWQCPPSRFEGYGSLMKAEIGITQLQIGYIERAALGRELTFPVTFAFRPGRLFTFLIETCQPVVLGAIRHNRRADYKDGE
jgi:hypothetical protein